MRGLYVLYYMGSHPVKTDQYSTTTPLFILWQIALSLSLPLSISSNFALLLTHTQTVEINQMEHQVFFLSKVYYNIESRRIECECCYYDMRKATAQFLVVGIFLLPDMFIWLKGVCVCLFIICYTHFFFDISYYYYYYYIFFFFSGAFLGSDEAVRFQGNTTSKDHFRLLQSDGEFVLVGAR